MAKEEELKLADSSKYSGLFDVNGNLDKTVETMTQISDIVKGIEEDYQKYLNDQLTGGLALEAFEKEARQKAQAAQAKAVENRKNILKIEIEIDKAREKGDTKALKNLEKRKKLVEATQQIEKKTKEIVEKYSEDMEARENLRKAQKEAQEQGKKLLSDG